MFIICKNGVNNNKKEIGFNNIGPVKHILKTINYDINDYGDLVEVGIIGLIYAVKKFDSKKIINFQFMLIKVLEIK